MGDVMGIHETIKIKTFGSNSVELCKVNNEHYVVYGGKTSHPKFDPSADNLEDALKIFDKLVYLFDPENEK